jgi:hypothetical protein
MSPPPATTADTRLATFAVRAGSFVLVRCAISRSREAAAAVSFAEVARWHSNEWALKEPLRASMTAL